MHPTYKHAVCRPLDIHSVTLRNGFWLSVVEQGRTAGLPALLKEYEQRNIVRNFLDAAAGRERNAEENGDNYDEFLFKALEACNHSIGRPENDPLSDQYVRIRDAVLAAEQADGYLNTLAIQNGTPRHTPQTSQELYAGGHLVQAGIAEWTVTGQSRLFHAARRSMDCLIDGYGLDGQGLHKFRSMEWPDHPNVESALVELYRVTGDKKYLDFCGAILKFSRYPERNQMLNHAVCEILHAAGGADYYLETGDLTVWDATRRLWRDLLTKVYVTGGVGSTDRRKTTMESVGKAFALTNDQAYAETCAAIALLFWSWRMFLASGDPAYMDMFERALYNGVLAGVSLDGCAYFYENPLEYQAVCSRGSAAVDDEHADFRGNDFRRKAWHHCSCCPPNVQRLLASFRQYIYAIAERDVWVNLFADSKATLTFRGHEHVTIVQETDYPWDGRVKFTLGVRGAREVRFSLNVRIPAWAAGTSLSVNHEPERPVAAGEYVALTRSWKDGDRVTVVMPMPAYLVQSHPRNLANYEKLVLCRGPLVYCLEGVDNPNVDIFRVMLPAEPNFKPLHRDPELRGAVVLQGTVRLRDDREWETFPYRVFRPDHGPTVEPVVVKAIPYFAWANRGKHSMLTALPYYVETT